MEKISLIDYGFLPSMDLECTNGIPARIAAVHKERYEIICEYGITYARLKSSVYFKENSYEVFPTTGDFVSVQYNPSGDCLITKTLERKSFFSRRDPTPGRGEQAVAANFDYVFIMTSLNNNFKVNRVVRYVTQSWQSGAVPVIILTKADLAENIAGSVSDIEKVIKNVCIIPISSKTGYGMDLLQDYLKPRKTIVFLGSSGVGKSTLLNTLAGEDIMEIKEIREDDDRGRHTTTARQLIMLKNGVMIIDTPGMRELGMWDVSVGLGETFVDVDELLQNCKFNDCTHTNEPGCAIIKAIEDGALTLERWQSYKSLAKEAKFSNNKINYMRARTGRNKPISKKDKQFYGNKFKYDAE